MSINTSESVRPTTAGKPSNGPSSAITVIIVVASNSNGSSRRTRSPWMVIGATIAAIPNTRPRLLMFDPTTLPNASAVSPRRLPTMFTTSSGELVPKPTMVSPTIIGEIPNAAAISEAPRTKSVPPPRSKSTPRQTPAKATILRVYNNPSSFLIMMVFELLLQIHERKLATIY